MSAATAGLNAGSAEAFDAAVSAAQSTLKRETLRHSLAQH
jgi:hypothetical protein